MDDPFHWRWPFVIANLPGDPLEPVLAPRLDPRATSLRAARHATISSDDPVAEVLVIGSDASRALERVHARGLRLRCALVLVVSPESQTRPPGFAQPHDAQREWTLERLREIGGRVGARGVFAMPAALSPEAIADALIRFAAALDEFRPLEVALRDAFGDGLLVWLDPEFAGLRARRPLMAAPPPVQAAPPPVSPAPPPERRVRAGNGGNVRAGNGAGGAEHRPDDHTAARPESAGAAPDDVEAQAPAEGARFIQQRSFRESGGAFVRENRGYVLGEAVRVHVRIGPRDDAQWASAPTPFPDHELPKKDDSHTLLVVLHEPAQFDEPMLREIELRRTGPSDEAIFDFTPRAVGAFEARISVLHRGRVLQTALLCTRVAARRRTIDGTPATPPLNANANTNTNADEEDANADDGGAIVLLDEAQVRLDWSGLGARRRFDLALVLNHGAVDHVPRLTAVAERRAWATSLDGIAEPLLQLNTALSNAARSVADHADGLDRGDNPRLLVDLARIGADLYSALVLDQFAALSRGGLDVADETITHIQVVSARADAVVPIEFFYDYPPPAADTKQVCPGFRDALKNGRCPTDCAGRSDPAAWVCPMGFWGLRKVIERHVYSPALGKPDGAEVVIQAEPAAGRDRLELGSCVLVGSSRQVPKASLATLLATLAPRFGNGAVEAADWDAWKQAVGLRKPSLLVAFPHNEGKRQDLKLEIGGSLLATLRLPRDYVRVAGAPPPLVFLLGCDVAGTAEQFSNHVRYFRQAGAAVVISTIATVFGEHAVVVGEKILARLLRAGGDDADQIGELIRDARREALLESVPMALCVVAFGDADWRL